MSTIRIHWHEWYNGKNMLTNSKRVRALFTLFSKCQIRVTYRRQPLPLQF